MKLKKFFLILGKKIMIFKLELSPQNFHYDVLYPLYSGALYIVHYVSIDTVHTERQQKRPFSEPTQPFR